MARHALIKPEYTRHTAIKAVPTLLDRLSFEHRQIKHLWIELQRAHNEQVFGRYAPDAQRIGDTRQHELSRRLVEVVLRHEAVERDALYPLAARAMSDVWVDEAKAAHTDSHDLLEEVIDQDPEDEGVYATFNEVLPRLIAHIDEEETILFPIMRLGLSSEELVNPPEDETTEFVILSRCERLPAIPHRFALLPARPEVIDLAAAEREASASDHGHGHVDVDGDVDVDVDGDEHVDGDGRQSADGPADGDGHAEANGHANSDGHADANGNANGDGHADANGHANGGGQADGDADGSGGVGREKRRARIPARLRRR